MAGTTELEVSEGGLSSKGLRLGLAGVQSHPREGEVCSGRRCAEKGSNQADTQISFIEGGGHWGGPRALSLHRLFIGAAS